MHLLNNEISKCFSAELGHISAPLFADVFHVGITFMPVRVLSTD